MKTVAVPESQRLFTSMYQMGQFLLTISASFCIGAESTRNIALIDDFRPPYLIFRAKIVTLGRFYFEADGLVNKAHRCMTVRINIDICGMGSFFHTQLISGRHVNVLVGCRQLHKLNIIKNASIPVQLLLPFRTPRVVSVSFLVNKHKIFLP